MLNYQWFPVDVSQPIPGSEDTYFLEPIPQNRPNRLKIVQLLDRKATVTDASLIFLLVAKGDPWEIFAKVMGVFTSNAGIQQL